MPLQAPVSDIPAARPATGGIPACSEMQARLFAQILSGKRALPSKGALLQIILDERLAEESAFRGSPEIKTVVGFVSYMDGLATLVGCMPPLWLMGFQPWKWSLLFKCVVGGCNALQYRLYGPHATPTVARKTLLQLPIGFSPSQIAAILVRGEFMSSTTGHQHRFATEYLYRGIP